MKEVGHMLRKMLVLVVLAALCGSVPTAFADGGPSDLKKAKRATLKYRDLDTAKAAGYGLLVDAQKIACIDMPGVGAMGVHYVNGTYVGDAVVDAVKPEALVYEPQGDGGQRLVALEYVVFQAPWDAQHASPPSLFGRPFSLTLKPNRYGLDAFYSLHAWIYKSNPLGTFAPWNPRVSCTPESGGGDNGDNGTHGDRRTRGY
jgi:hypothetical protein